MTNPTAKLTNPTTTTQDGFTATEASFSYGRDVRVRTCNFSDRDFGEDFGSAAVHVLGRDTKISGLRVGLQPQYDNVVVSYETEDGVHTQVHLRTELAKAIVVEWMREEGL